MFSEFKILPEKGAKLPEARFISVPSRYLFHVTDYIYRSVLSLFCLVTLNQAVQGELMCPLSMQYYSKIKDNRNILFRGIRFLGGKLSGATDINQKDEASAM